MNKTRQNKGKGVGDEKALEVLAVIVLFLKCQHYLLRKIHLWKIEEEMGSN